jgi:hypothetical protein
MKEQNIQSQIMLALSKARSTVFRCNTGKGWQGSRRADIEGKLLAQYGSRFVVLENPRVLHAGLTEGGSDLIGWTSDGKFLAVEVKNEKGRLTPDQERFINAVKSSGGRAGVARSVDDAIGILEG